MGTHAILAALASLALAACTAAPAPTPDMTLPPHRPLDSLPGDADLGLVRTDLVATAADRFGSAAVQEAFAAPTYLIAKRFIGMAPPPPPGADARWVAPTPTALMRKNANGWMIATEHGWRQAKIDAAAEIEQVIADPAFWGEEPANLPCPDYGASLLLLKVPGKAETVRNSRCTSIGEIAVLAALRA